MAHMEHDTTWTHHSFSTSKGGEYWLEIVGPKTQQSASMEEGIHILAYLNQNVTWQWAPAHHLGNYGLNKLPRIAELIGSNIVIRILW